MSIKPHVYMGDYEDRDPGTTLWDPLTEWWLADGGPWQTLSSEGVVSLELNPGDVTHYGIIINDVRGSYSRGYVIAVSIFSPYNLCAMLPPVSSGRCEENAYALDKFGSGRAGIPKGHRCARLMISRLTALASGAVRPTNPTPTL